MHAVGHEGDGAKGDGYRLASSRVSLVLAMEVALSRRQTKSAARNPPVDPRHEPCQPTLGCSPDPWRTPQARHQCGSNLGRQIYGRSAGTPIARMEDVPARCCTGLCQFRPNRVKYGRTRTTSTTLFRVCQQCRVSVVREPHGHAVKCAVIRSAPVVDALPDLGTLKAPSGDQHSLKSLRECCVIRVTAIRLAFSGSLA